MNHKGAIMKKVNSQISYEVKCDKHERYCTTCRKRFSDEPFAVRKIWHGRNGMSLETRCWRCWHTWEIIHLFLDKYPKLFNYAKRGGWYYLKLASDQFHFPSSDGEFDPDW